MINTHAGHLFCMDLCLTMFCIYNGKDKVNIANNQTQKDRFLPTNPFQTE